MPTALVHRPQRAALRVLAAATVPLWIAMGPAALAVVLGRTGMALVFTAAGLLASAAAGAGALVASAEADRR